MGTLLLGRHGRTEGPLHDRSALGGRMSAAAQALGVAEESAFALTLVVRNASASELLFSGSLRSLQSFNSMPGLPPAPEP